jgi:uncharacterized membrane protein YeaQ/YmgE (transglycosylase-associated protein family)
MHLLSILSSGFIVGLVARAVMPGDQKMGMIRTTLLGVSGSFAGSVLSNVIASRPWNTSQNISFLGSVGGAIAVMLAARLIRGK